MSCFCCYINDHGQHMQHTLVLANRTLVLGRCHHHLVSCIEVASYVFYCGTLRTYCLQ